jgi:hypothetical protein
MRHCAPELGWLSLVNVTKTPPKGVVLECAGKPRAGALGLKLALAVTAISLRACSSCSECNPFARYLKRTSQRVGWVCPLSVPNVVIDRVQESATGSIERTYSKAKLPSVFAGSSDQPYLFLPPATSPSFSSIVLPLRRHFIRHNHSLKPFNPTHHRMRLQRLFHLHRPPKTPMQLIHNK